MSVEIVTKEDLENLRKQLVEDIKALLSKSGSESKQWLRSRDLQKFLKVSPGTLQNLRVNGTLPYTKIGGVLYYAYEDVLRLLQSNKFNNHMSDNT